MKTLVMALLLLGLTGCARNVDFVKERASARWAELGYEIIAYEGYKLSLDCGGDVWYSLKRKDTPRVIYTGYLCKWGDELHVYGPQVVGGSQMNITQDR